MTPESEETIQHLARAARSAFDECDYALADAVMDLLEARLRRELERMHRNRQVH